MRTVAVISQKGGAGKTTLALHLAAAAQAAGVVTLVLDADPQATASTWSTWREGREPEVIDCASPPLLAKKLDQAAQLGAELAIIDTPPHADSMSAAACRAADLILVPCRPRGFDLAAVQATADLVRVSGKPGFVIFTAGPQRAGKLYAEAADVISDYGLTVAPVVMTERAAYHQATTRGLTAPEVEPQGKAAAEVAALWTWASERVNLSTRQPRAEA